MTARALEFTILTAARSAEVLEARWSEIDLKAKTWTRPAARMKAEQEHTVPLSPRALAILQALPRGRDEDFIFLGRPGHPLGHNAMSRLLPTIEGGSSGTVHGMRSSFRDWAGDRTSFPREIAEAALAHTLGGVEAAYRRSSALEKRAKLMAAWSAYCAAPPAGEVVPLRSASGGA